MKIKKALPLLVSLIMLGGTFAGVAGCKKGGGSDDNKHVHNYQWKDLGNGKHIEKCQSTTGTCDAPTRGEEKAHENELGNDDKCDKCGATVESGGSGEDETSTPLPADKKVYLVGDSTVCDYGSGSAHSDVAKNERYVVRYGYGTQLHEYLNVTKDQVVNLAASGRSSLSFPNESAENYSTLINNISAGDYLIIGFGHNDQKTDAAHYSNPNLTTTDSSTTNGPSFRYTLYEKYIKVAEEAGATPILCTPIVRYNSDTSKYNGSNGHITEDKTSGGVTYKGGDYPQAIRDLAAEKGVALVDLTAITKQIYTTEGKGALQYHAYYTYRLDTDGTTKIPSTPDGTHLNELGAKMVAYQFAQALKTTECTLKAQVRTSKAAPTYENDFIDRVNESYVKPTATPFVPSMASTLWTDVTQEGWYGSVFGNLGGNNKVAKTNFSISASNGTYVIEAKANGKLADTDGFATDGFATIFMPIAVDKDFTAEVTANITLGSTNSQSSFGLMLRDDMYIDKNDPSLGTNYVSAGVLNGGAVFAVNESVRTSTKGAATLDASSTYTLKIQKSGTSITATVIQGNTTVTETYTDVYMNVSDGTNMYLCLYAIRNITATFTNVTVTINQ